MHNLLETYLLRVGDQLDELPKSKQQQEVSELTDHIMQSCDPHDEDALREALDSMGHPVTIGRKIAVAHRRGIWKSREQESNVAALFVSAFAIPPIGIAGINFSFIGFDLFDPKHPTRLRWEQLKSKQELTVCKASSDGTDPGGCYSTTVGEYLQNFSGPAFAFSSIAFYIILFAAVIKIYSLMLKAMIYVRFDRRKVL